MDVNLWAGNGSGRQQLGVATCRSYQWVILWLLLSSRRLDMTHYKSNLRDLEFNLFEVFNTEAALGHELYADIDKDTAKDILSEVARIAENDLAEPFSEADRNPPVFDPATNSVTMPESFKRAYNTMMDDEYWRLDLPPELDGTNAPRSLWWALGD